MYAYFWVALGSALGGIARFALSGAVANRIGETFPWGTLTVNVLGSLTIGFFAALAGPDSRLLVSPLARQFVAVGLCGGFTTFSAFSLQTLNLARDGEWFRAGGNVVLSVVTCLAAVGIGYAVAEALNK